MKNHSEDTSQKPNLMGLVAAFGLGAAASFYLDPDRGRKRRVLVKDQFVHLRHKSDKMIDVTRRDIAHRLQGIFAQLRSSLPFRSSKIDDEVLVARIRSKLGRYVSHPHSIEVASKDGKVSLRGPILHHEMDRLLAIVAKMKGIRDFSHDLTPHKQNEQIPSLQGGILRQGERLDFFQSQWSPSTRFLLGGLGGALLLANVRRGGILRLGLASLGSGFFLRALTNLETKSLLGLRGKGNLTVHKTINISAPIEKVFEQWSHFENFPKFMTHVKEVRLSQDGQHSHWTVDGPAGVPIKWEAALTRFVPNEILAWKSLPGAAIQNAGRIQFRKNEKGETRVDLDFSYRPPVGALGHLAALIFGVSPKSQFEEGLYQIKTLIEKGPSQRQVRGLH